MAGRARRVVAQGFGDRCMDIRKRWGPDGENTSALAMSKAISKSPSCWGLWEREDHIPSRDSFVGALSLAFGITAAEVLWSYAEKGGELPAPGAVATVPALDRSPERPEIISIEEIPARLRPAPGRSVRLVSLGGGYAALTFVSPYKEVGVA